MDSEVIIRVLNLIQSLFAWLEKRGIRKDRIQRILDDARGGDISTTTVEAEIEAAQSELDETGELLGD